MNILKELTLTKLEFIKFQLKIVLKDLDYNDRDLTYLAYIYLYKDKAKEFFLRDKLSNSRASIDNYISKYKKDSVVEKVGSELILNKNIFLTVENSTYTFKITITEDEA